MIPLYLLLAACAVAVKMAASAWREERQHKPRALELAVKHETKLLEVAKPARGGNPYVGSQTLAGAIMGGLAKFDGTCVRCGGYWNEAHGDAPHDRHRPWSEPVKLPIAGPGSPRRG